AGRVERGWRVRRLGGGWGRVARPGLMRKGRTCRLLLPALLALFGFGVVRLLQLRFETGDIYPPYSSLRVDPLGTRAFYESLETLRGVTVQRFIEQWTKLPEGRNTTLFVFGA